MSMMDLMKGARRICDACGAPVEWVDPCSLALCHRQQWDEAITAFGRDAVMDGRAWECTSTTCSQFGLMPDIVEYGFGLD